MKYPTNRRNKAYATPFSILAALPDFITAAIFLLVWVNPLIFGSFYLNDLMVVMILEFFTIHASGFLFSILENRSGLVIRLVISLLLSVVYFSFISLIAKFVGDAKWPLITFGIFYGKRVFAYVLNKIPQTDEEKQTTMQAWKAEVLCFIGFGFITTSFPIPSLGITPDIVALIRTPNSGGLWVDSPQILTAFGFLYFTAIGLFGYVNNCMVRRI